MTLADILESAKKHIVAMVITVVAIVGITCVIAMRETPVYTASARYYAAVQWDGEEQVSNEQITSDQTFVKSQMGLLTEFARTSVVLKPVVDQLHLDTTADALSDSVSVIADSDSQFLTISARDTDPNVAADIANAVGESLNKKIASNDLGDVKTSALSTIALQVIKPAKAPTSPSSDNRSTLLIGGLVAVVSAFLVAIALELGNRKLRDLTDLGRCTDSPVLGLIPSSDKFAEGAAVISHADSREAENVRRLSRNLAFVSPDRTELSNVIVVTSPAPSDGKTTVAVNVAAAFAENNKKVLLIDADLRRPAVPRVLGMDGTIGLSHLVTGQTDSKTVIQPYWRSNFHVLPAGEQTTNPSIIINSRAMMSLLEQVATSYDYVVVDTAPLTVTNDAIVFSKHGAPMLMVVSQGGTLKHVLRDSLQELAMVGVQIVGVVFNRVRVSHDSSKYYSYYSRNDVEPRKYGRARVFHQLSKHGGLSEHAERGEQ